MHNIRTNFMLKELYFFVLIFTNARLKSEVLFLIFPLKYYIYDFLFYINIIVLIYMCIYVIGEPVKVQEVQEEEKVNKDAEPKTIDAETEVLSNPTSDQEKNYTIDSDNQDQVFVCSI